MSIEQQLADAIAAQNLLTQTVSAQAALMKAQVDAAVASTRVFTNNNIIRARSVLHLRSVDLGELPGAFFVETPIQRLSNSMFRLDVTGYDYGEGKIIDFSVALGLAGQIISSSAIRKGNTAKNSIWVGINAADRVCLVFGSAQAVNRFVFFTVDMMLFSGIASTNPVDWHGSIDNSVSPAVGATVGFGLSNLISL